MHVARIALRVSDVEQSTGFYERVAGLAARERSADRAQLGAPAGGPVLLELRRAQRAGQAPRRAAGLFHTAFRFPGRGDLGTALARVLEERVPLAGASDHLVSEALYLDDPDGLGIELYRDRPREEWPAPAPGDRVRMDTLPLDLRALLDDAGRDGEDGAVDVGHVHLKVADVEAAVEFWTRQAGLELMTRFGAEAAFLADDGYHHHVGANTWMSRGAALEPADGPGLDEVVLGGAAGERELRTPDGILVRLEAAAGAQAPPA